MAIRLAAAGPAAGWFTTIEDRVIGQLFRRPATFRAAPDRRWCDGGIGGLAYLGSAPTLTAGIGSGGCFVVAGAAKCAGNLRPVLAAELVLAQTVGVFTDLVAARPIVLAARPIVGVGAATILGTGRRFGAELGQIFMEAGQQRVKAVIGGPEIGHVGWRRVRGVEDRADAVHEGPTRNVCPRVCKPRASRTARREAAEVCGWAARRACPATVSVPQTGKSFIVVAPALPGCGAPAAAAR